MKKGTRWVVLGIGQLAVLMALAMSAAPAQASPFAVLVDDDGRQCKTTVHSIQAAVDMAVAFGGTDAKTITVCKGTYPEQVHITGVTNLVLQGRASAIVVPPKTPFLGTLITVASSAKVTVTGLTIDGQHGLGTTGGRYGIEFVDSYGSITDNTFRGWRQASLLGTVNYDYANIYVNVPGPTARKVTIGSNTFADYQGKGVFATGPAILTITRNRFTLTPSGSNSVTGIELDGVVAGGNFNTNTFTGSGEHYSFGIILEDSAFLVIEKNTFRKTSQGIMLDSDCLHGYQTVFNVIRKNTFTDVSIGVQMFAGAVSFLGCDARTDFNQVINNKFRMSARTPDTIAVLIDTNDDDVSSAPSAFAINETVTGNVITHYENAIVTDSSLGGTISGTFSPNIIHP